MTVNLGVNNGHFSYTFSLRPCLDVKTTGISFGMFKMTVAQNLSYNSRFGMKKTIILDNGYFG